MSGLIDRPPPPGRVVPAAAFSLPLAFPFSRSLFFFLSFRGGIKGGGKTARLLRNGRAFECPFEPRDARSFENPPRLCNVRAPDILEIAKLREALSWKMY